MERIKKEEKITTVEIDRRSFISRTSLAALGTIGSAGLISSCSREPARKKLKLPVLLTQAPDGKPLKGRTDRLWRQGDRSSGKFP